MTNKKGVVKYSELLVCYKNLFTKKQLSYMTDYFMNDLSFSETGDKHGVSSMAVADSIKHSKKTLIEYENKLHLYKTMVKRNKVYQNIKDVKLRKKLMEIDNI